MNGMQMAVSLAAQKNPNFTGDRGPSTQRASQAAVTHKSDGQMGIQKDFDANMI